VPIIYRPSEEKRNISQRREAMTHSLHCHRVKALHGEDVCLLCSTFWHFSWQGTAKDTPQDLSTFSQQRSAFSLSSSLSSRIKQDTSSDVSSTSTNFVVQPRLLRRFAGGLCCPQTDVGPRFISAQHWPTGRQADSPIPWPRQHVIGSCGRVTQDSTLW